MDEDYPYQAEFAPTGKAACRLCKDLIAEGTPRIAALIQSPGNDKKFPKWYHFTCFLKCQHPKAMGDIFQVAELKFEDQEQIRKQIERRSTQYRPDFRIDYAKYGGIRCTVCDIVIRKNELRISKHKKQFVEGYRPPWHHIDCFVAIRDELRFAASAKELPGFNALNPEDKATVNEKIKAIEVPDFEMDEKSVYKKQSLEIFHHRDQLKSNLNEEEISAILKENNQLVGRLQKNLNLLSDIMTFGALERCPECKTGQLKFINQGYKCTGRSSEWANCVFLTKIPVRSATAIPKELAEKHPFLGSYKCNTQERFIPDYQQSGDSLNLNKLKLAYEQPAPKSQTLRLKRGAAVDPDSGLEQEAHVFRDKDGKYTVALCQTDVQTGKNSYHKIQVLEADKGGKFWFFRSWGRIGTTIGDKRLEEHASLADAKKAFEDLYLKKTKNEWANRDSFKKFPNTYYPLDIDYGGVADDDAVCGLSEASNVPLELDNRVEDLLKLIFDIKEMKKVMAEFELDMERMPLGKLSQKQILEAFGVLTELSNFILEKNAPAAKLVDASNRFYTLIPHSFGVAKPTVLDSLAAVRKKMNMLDTLLEIEVAYTMLLSVQDDGKTNPIESHFRQLKADIVPLEPTDAEYEYLCRYVKNTHGATHTQYDLHIETIYRVARSEEAQRYEPFKRLHNRRLLWHGSRLTNFAGILSNGLKIAPLEAPSTGYMFGKGIYFADMVSKSANYCYPTGSDCTGLMLLCEVALGEMKVCMRQDATALPPGMHSTMGKGRTYPNPAEVLTRPDGVVVPYGKPVTDPSTYSSLLYNEFIVYDPAQVNVQYLFKINFKRKY